MKYKNKKHISLALLGIKENKFLPTFLNGSLSHRNQGCPENFFKIFEVAKPKEHKKSFKKIPIKLENYPKIYTLFRTQSTKLFFDSIKVFAVKTMFALKIQ